MTIYNGPQPLGAARPGGWIVHLTCCGYDDGLIAAPTWERADELRESYLTAVGHDRSAIIVAGFEPSPDNPAPCHP